MSFLMSQAEQKLIEKILELFYNETGQRLSLNHELAIEVVVLQHFRSADQQQLLKMVQRLEGVQEEPNVNPLPDAEL